MNDQPSRFETAAEQARRNFEDARRRLDDGRDAESGSRFERLRAWGSGLGTRKILWIAGGLILLALFIWWLLPRSTYQGMRGMGGPQPVGVAVVQRGSIEVMLPALGTVTPLATVTVRPQVSGQIMKFDFEEGQMVKAGDLLAEIDPRTFQAALGQAQGSLARDMALLVNARIELKRQQALMAAKATSQQNVDNQVAQEKQYEGIVKSDQANVDAAAVNLGYTRVTSPIAGRAGIRQVDLGNFVSAGQTNGIVVVTQLQPISVLFPITENQVQAVITRINSGEQLAVEAWDHDLTTKLAEGHLSAVDSQVDVTTGTVKMRAMFDNADNTLFPNQFVNVKLLVNTLRDQVVIPASAVQRGSDSSFVFVVKADHTVAMRAITTGQQQGDRIAVVKGLNPGETVVTDGADRLREGAEVTIPSGQKVQNVKPAEGAAALGGQAARDAQRAAFLVKLQKVCGDDIKKYCGDAKGFMVMRCLRENEDSLSSECQAARKAMRGARGRGGNGGRGGP